MLDGYTNLLQQPQCGSSVEPSLTHSSPLCELIELQKLLAQDAGITSYRDPKTGRTLSYEDYWEKKQFESQPGYIFGQLLRKAAEGTFRTTRSAIDFVKRGGLYLKERLFSELINKEDEEDFPMFSDEEMASALKNYHKLKAKIAKAKKQAEKERKPLLILIGESHVSRHSLLIEMLTMLLIKDDPSFSAKIVFSEPFPVDEYKKAWGNIDGNVQILEPFLTELHFSVIPMDFAVCNLETFKSFTSCKTPTAKKVINDFANEGEKIKVSTENEELKLNKMFKLRNTIMDKVMTECASGNAVGIVGMAHLYGLIQETDLSDKYTVLAINAVIDINHEFDETIFESLKHLKVKKLLRFAFSEKAVFQFEQSERALFPWNEETMLSRYNAEKAKAIISNQANEIHWEATRQIKEPVKRIV